MIVCDNEMKIRYVNAKYPGATHDSAVFNMSALKPQLEDDYHRGERNILLGDAGYALQPYMLTPFRNLEEGSAESIKKYEWYNHDLKHWKTYLDLLKYMQSKFKHIK
ncbi:PREDICTED: uncharacterized protein LOC108364652 [Rhagoletis zephyria]|uniref:uncharacterized protein LOC108364652 n=1 Tax=Rhagoletis zephyria TaxID=28612 RepID=UPI0008112DB6|nr:PREDICTED: uncharacterized protein LOC108364652 [Rhagoletis zephyria]